MVSSNWPPSERVVRRPPMALERSARFANPRPPRRSGWLAASCSNPSRTGGAQTHRHVAPDPTDKPHGGSPSAGQLDFVRFGHACILRFGERRWASDYRVNVARSGGGRGR